MVATPPWSVEALASAGARIERSLSLQSPGVCIHPSLRPYWPYWQPGPTRMNGCSKAARLCIRRLARRPRDCQWEGISRIIGALLDAGANPLASDDDGQTPWDVIQENEALRGSGVYWRMNEARFNEPQE